jgi:hypothetical protein
MSNGTPGLEDSTKSSRRATMFTISPSARFLGRAALVAGAVLAAAALAVAGFVMIREAQWAHLQFRDAKDAFFAGSIGTEFAPQPVLEAMPDLCPDHFKRPGSKARDWLDEFGFIHSPDPQSKLPLGFTISNYRPKSGAPSPVPFAGIGCVACHSTHMRRSDLDEGPLVIGVGNTSLNMFAFLDAFQAAALDERVSVESVAEHHRRTRGQDLTFEQKLIIRLWLRQTRQLITSNEEKYDTPFGSGRSFGVDAVPTGPARTQPFRTLIRTVLHRPGAGMFVYTKIAPVYWENLEAWSQFDGTIHDLNARSSMAALAAGATVTNMAKPEIVHNIEKSTDFTRTLRGPTFKELFPQKFAGLDKVAVQRGQVVYQDHCFRCHGKPRRANWDDAYTEWDQGSENDVVVPYEQIGTDHYRVTFRHSRELADRLFEHFPEKHPFHFKREDLRPGPSGEVLGYVNKPMHSMFTRAPFLHNASVMTLAELINLKPRRAVFYRGQNLYDPDDVGLSAPDKPDERRYFKFDTAEPGNSNAGHDYPWRYQGPGWDPKILNDLLQYLKTL